MIRWEVRDRVGVATIDRPETRNALNAELCLQLLGHLESVPDLRAVVVTGAGDKAFCAGADLAVRAADTAEPGGADTFRPAFDRLLDAIVDYSAPVLAAVNGPAIGAGMQLAVACDLRVAVFNATFSIPAARLGVFLSPRNVARLAALVGQGAARDLLLAARTLDADEAAAVGLVQRRVPDALSSALAPRGGCAMLVRTEGMRSCSRDPTGRARSTSSGPGTSASRTSGSSSTASRS